MTDARYVLVLLDEPNARFPLVGSVTVGRHLDNDLVIAGEDVRDFHVRIETTQRGPKVIVLEAAAAHRNQLPIDESVGMRPGDELMLGHHRLRLEIETSAGVHGWNLHRIGDGQGVAVAPKLMVGRATDCDLQLVEGHVSRHHAQLSVEGDTIWVEDFNSANGTYVNGDRVIGAWRLFHGDEVTFDTMRYQLIGDAPDLTPIRLQGPPPDQLAAPEPVTAGRQRDAAPEMAQLPNTTVEASMLQPVPLSDEQASVASGPALVGRSAPVSGRVFPLAFGRHLIGRAPEADIHLAEPSVSLRHAELELQPDGARLVNLISTNGTWVNGAEVHAARLTNGDLVRIGRVTLQYRAHETPAHAPRARWMWTAAGAVTVLIIVFLLVLRVIG